MEAKVLDVEIMPETALVLVEAPAIELDHSSSLVTILGFSDTLAIDHMTKSEIRAVIFDIEKMCKEFGEEIEIPVKHHFSKNVYAREMQMPQGALIVGKIHKHENLNILSAGEVSVLSVDGIKRVKAPYTFVASEGAKRVIYAHKECIWTTIHGTDERDIEKIEADFIVEDYSDLYLKSDRSLNAALNALGFTPEELTQISENEFDQTPFPKFVNSVTIMESPIHGKGMFVEKDFKAGDVIAPARLNGKRTPAGRYVNHFSEPNSAMVQDDSGDVYVIALADITSGTEVLADYFFNYMNSRGTLCLG